jgi:hypothetical protein
MVAQRGHGTVIVNPLYSIIATPDETVPAKSRSHGSAKRQ